MARRGGTGVTAGAGAIAGARAGVDAIPGPWLERLEARDHLLETAEAVADLDLDGQ